MYISRPDFNGDVMSGYGAISYTRSYVRAAAVRWHSSDFKTITTLEQFRDKFADRYDDKKPDGLIAEWPIQDRSANPEQHVRKAVAWLKDRLKKPTGVCIAGYGPFSSLNYSDDNFGGVHETSDPPFRNQPVYHWVKDELGDSGKSDISVMPDAAAMATFGYWKTVRAEKLSTYGKPHVVASIIVGDGIGGAFAGAFGARLDQNYQSEIGHIGAIIHPDDTLRFGGCPIHDHRCFQGRASGYALRRRMEEYFDHKLDERSFKEAINIVTHEYWNFESFYLGQLCAAMVLIMAPTKICIGGSVFKDLTDENKNAVLEKIRLAYRKFLENYVAYPEAYDDDLIILTDRGNSTLKGALLRSMTPKLQSTLATDSFDLVG